MVIVKVLSPEQQTICTFTGVANKTLIEQMEDAAFDMPYSCRAGACMTCAVVVKKGQQVVDQELGGEKFIDTDEDQILTCIAGIQTSAIEEEQEHELHLELIDFY